MNLFHSTIALACCLLTASVHAQTNLQVGHMLVCTTAVPCTGNQVVQIMKAEATRTAVDQACASADAKLNDLRIEAVAVPRSSDSGPATTHELWFTLYLDVSVKLTDAATATLYERVVQDVQRRLDERLIGEQRSIDQHRHQRLLEEAENLRRQIMALRKQLVGFPTATADTIRSGIADLERKRLDTQLDLRTEEATLERLQAMLNDTKARADDAGAHHRTVAIEHAETERRLSALRSRLGEGAPAEADLQLLVAKVADLSNQNSTAKARSQQLVALLEALAEESRKSTVASHRLSARMRVIDDLLVEQAKRLDAATAADGERMTVLTEVSSLEASLDEVRIRTRQTKDRLDQLEPVRLQIWK